jgi:G3E family GTPase
MMLLTPAFDEAAPRLLLLSGFLGSGKTTLLRRVLERAEPRSIAAIVNEIAEVGIDHYLVEKAVDDVELLANGCVCCTARDGLESAAFRLLEKRASKQGPSFETMMIETTGLADPLAALTTLRASGGPLAGLSSTAIVITLDAVHGSDQIEHYSEARRQIAAADLLVLTKSAYARPALVTKLIEQARQINSHAPLLDASCSDDQLVQTLLSIRGGSRFVAIDAESTGHTPGIDTISLSSAEPVRLDVLTFWLQELCEELGPDLLRAKGVFSIKGIPDPVVVHCVSGVVYPAVRLQALEQSDYAISELVLIGRGLHRQKLQRAFLDLHGNLARAADIC